MDREDELKRKMDYLDKGIRTSGVFSLKSGSVREAVVQALLSRGDRKLALCILDAAEKGSSVPVAMRRAGLDSFISKMLLRAFTLTRPATTFLPEQLAGSSIRKFSRSIRVTRHLVVKCCFQRAR